MIIQIRLFALLRDRAGVAELALSLPDHSTCADAIEAVALQFPSTTTVLRRVACAVDQEYVQRGTVLCEGQELALIPPVSGG